MCQVINGRKKVRALGVQLKPMGRLSTVIEPQVQSGNTAEKARYLKSDKLTTKTDALKLPYAISQMEILLP